MKVVDVPRCAVVAAPSLRTVSPVLGNGVAPIAAIIGYVLEWAFDCGAIADVRTGTILVPRAYGVARHARDWMKRDRGGYDGRIEVEQRNVARGARRIGGEVGLDRCDPLASKVPGHEHAIVRLLAEGVGVGSGPRDDSGGRIPGIDAWNEDEVCRLVPDGAVGGREHVPRSHQGPRAPRNDAAVRVQPADESYPWEPVREVQVAVVDRLHARPCCVACGLAVAHRSARSKDRHERRDEDEECTRTPGTFHRRDLWPHVTLGACQVNAVRKEPSSDNPTDRVNVGACARSTEARARRGAQRYTQGQRLPEPPFPRGTRLHPFTTSQTTHAAPPSRAGSARSDVRSRPCIAFRGSFLRALCLLHALQVLDPTRAGPP